MAATDSSARTTLTVIRPARGWIAVDFREIWDYRELLFSFTKRDFQVRYRQTLLGLAWAIVGPVTQAFVLTWLFTGRSGGATSTNGLPTFLYFMTNMVAWRYFSNAMTAASSSLVNNANMWTKIYFPRLLLPISSCLTGLIDLGVGLVLVFGVQVYYQIMPSAAIVFLPVFTLVMFAAALGIGLLFGALNVRFRDVSQLVPFIVQIWMFMTVIFPYERFHEKLGDWAWIYGLNPLAGVVEGFRWSLLNSPPGAGMATPWPLVGIGLIPTTALLLFGLFYFRRVENQFSDVV